MTRKRQRRRKSKSSPYTWVVLVVVFLAAACIQRFVDKKDEPARTEAVAVAETTSGGEPVKSVAVDVAEGLELPAPLGKARAEVLLTRQGYAASYNTEWKIPNWVAWKLTAERLKGKAKRTDDFLPDPDVPEKSRAEDRDYAGSRYDRGHMAPAGDMKWNQEAMAESFYLSNICPQAANLNRGDWRELEEQCRVWAKSLGDLYIACGPVVKSGVKHKRVGKNKVTVPDGFFKVILLMGEHPQAVGFLYPNDDCDAPLSAYAVTVDSVESVTGIDFFPRLDDEVERRIEAVVSTTLSR